MSFVARKSLLACMGPALMQVVSPIPALATVVLPPPPHASDLSIGLQKEIIRRLGGDMNLRLHRSVGGIAVSGDYAGSPRRGSFNLLIRDQRGWTSWRSGVARPVSAAVGAEIDRLLAGDDFWREDGFVYGQPCPGIGRVMQVFYRGRDEFSRQPCGPKGLAGRLADIVAAERVPLGPAPSVGRRDGMIRAARGSDYENKLPVPADPDAAGLVLFLTMQSVYSLREGRVEDHVEAYAEDVTMVWPAGAERGKEALRRHARSQTWNGVERRHLQPGEAYLRQTAPGEFVLTGTYGVWDEETPLNMPVTTRWQKRRGIWQITHQQIGAARAIPAAAPSAVQPTQ